MRATSTFAILFPVLSVYAVTFSKSLVSAYSTRIRLKFLKRCLEEQVLPRSLLTYRMIRFDNLPFNEFSSMTLKRHIEITKRQEKKAFKELEAARRAFRQCIPVAWKDSLFTDIYDHLHVRTSQLQRKLDNKLKRLIEKSDWTKNARQDCVVNLSSKPISEDVVRALGYGLSFHVTTKPSALSIGASLINLEKSCDLPQNQLDIIRGIVYCASKFNCENNFPLRYKKCLSQLKKDSDIHVTKADKSNSIVILDKDDYISRMSTLLEDNVTYKKLNKNPLSDVIKNFNKAIKTILKDHKEILNKVLVNSPSLPYLYGLVKTHKENNPMRPIISSTGSITYNLSRYITKLLSPLLGTISGSHLVNSVDLVEKLSNINFSPNIKLVSFDVCSLFTKVPIDSILEYLSNELVNHDLPLPLSDVISLIKLCICNCKFIFNNEFYEQTFGMAMGNPLSPLLSNLYMEFFERQHLPQIINIPIKWFRYVDDILVLLPNIVDANELLAGLNRQVPSIKFTLEMERDNCLPFLDVVIHREPFQCKFSIYRKPTNNLTYVHFYSGHNISIKKSIFSSMFLRALRIVSPEFLEEEIEFIRKIGIDLCYPSYIMDSCLDKAKKKFYNTENEVRPKPKNILCLPYYKGFEMVKELFKTFDVGVIFSYKNTLKNILIKNSPQQHDNVIYNIPCMDCAAFYIGQTSKGLGKRLVQHKYSVRTGQCSNALFIHLSENNHRINWNNSNVIAKCNDFRSRNLLESALIQITSGSNFNLSPGIVSLDPCLISMFKRDLKDIISKFTNRL